MSEPTQTTEVPHVDNLLDAPIIYFDAIPTVGARGGIVSALLATQVGEPVTSTTTSVHFVAVANLRFTLATAASLRDVLDKILLAASATPGQAN
jgi:hypothetical protein